MGGRNGNGRITGAANSTTCPKVPRLPRMKRCLVSQNHLPDGSGVVLLCKPKQACPNETGIFLVNNIFSISTGKFSGKKGRDTYALYVHIDMKLNQEGMMVREWGINNFRPSADRWFQEVELLMVPRSSSGLPVSNRWFWEALGPLVMQMGPFSS